MIPFVTGRSKADPHDFLVWHRSDRGTFAVRRGDMKLVGNAGRVELFDLSRDIGEETDLAALRPGTARELHEIFREWSAQMVAPLF